MRRLLLTLTLSTGVVVAIWLGVPNRTPNRVATCPVWLDDVTLARAASRGLSLRRHERLHFPVVRQVIDGGVSFDLPPHLASLRDLVHVKDWDDCTIDPVTAFPVAALQWDSGFPFTFSDATVRKCVRQKADAGLTCLRRRSDGGTYDYGDRNVFRRIEAANPGTCEPCECGIYLGEDPETDL